MQITDVNSTDNNSFLQYDKYPSLDDQPRDTWKEGVNRITAHTDESLMTLLFNSPGARSSWGTSLPNRSHAVSLVVHSPGPYISL